MGMFDEVRFSYRMPDGFKGGSFQTKSLDCLMDMYEVTPAGRLVRTHVFEETDRPLGDMNFSGELHMRGEFGGGDYTLEFVDGSLAAIRCKGIAGRLLFDPAHCINEQNDIMNA
nr:hypothetical protein 12.7 kDa [uncultured bacterium]